MLAFRFDPFNTIQVFQKKHPNQVKSEVEILKHQFFGPNQFTPLNKRYLSENEQPNAPDFLHFRLEDDVFFFSLSGLGLGPSYLVDLSNKYTKFSTNQLPLVLKKKSEKKKQISKAARICTLPETNSSSLKINALVQMKLPIFRGYSMLPLSYRLRVLSFFNHQKKTSMACFPRPLFVCFPRSTSLSHRTYLFFPTFEPSVTTGVTVESDFLVTPSIQRTQHCSPMAQHGAQHGIPFGCKNLDGNIIDFKSAFFF